MEGAFVAYFAVTLGANREGGDVVAEVRVVAIFIRGQVGVQGGDHQFAELED